MNLIEGHHHLKKVNEYLFSLLTERQLEEFMEWEQKYDHGMNVKEAIRDIYYKYYDEEEKGWKELNMPENHIYHAIMTLAEAYDEF